MIITRYITAIFCTLTLGLFLNSQENKETFQSASQNFTSKPIISNNRSIKKGAESSKIKPSASQKSSSEVGTTPASFDVSLSGSAIYNIPIYGPPGIKDVMPQISLSYNSQASNGLAGWGWSISGLSSIRKVSSTKFHDGFIDGVDFDSDDRFSLDGQRLLLKSGNYGENDSEYQTETYSNIKIKAIGTSPHGAGYGPNSFQVFYPDGRISYYGQSIYSDTRMEWALTKTVDPQQNFIEYKYSISGNLLRIEEIKYGAHSFSTSAPNTIKFYYKDRTRPEVSYVEGITFKRTKILDRIETYGLGKLFRKYVLSHDQTSLDYDILTSVTEYNKLNENLTPIVFNYDSSPVNPNPGTYTSSISPIYDYQNDVILSGEFSGDGKLDFIIYDENVRNNLNVFDNINSTSSNIGTSINVSKFDDIISNDMLDASGKKIAKQGLTMIEENMAGGVSTVSFKSYYYNGSGLNHEYTKQWDAPTNPFETSCSSTVQKIIPKEYLSGDFNGDGLTDVLAIGKPHDQQYCFEILGCTGKNCCFCDPLGNFPYKYVHFIDLNRNLTSNFAYGSGNLLQTLSDSDRLLAADFNGDGKTDLFHFKDGRVDIYGLDSNNQLFLIHTETDSFIELDRPILLGDYNGDGKVEFITPTVDSSEDWRFFISRGNSIEKYTKFVPDFNYKEAETGLFSFSEDPGWGGRYALVESRYAAQDMNGDGKTDLIKNIIATSNSTSPYRTDEIVRVFTNHYDNADGRPKFLNPTLFYEANTDVSRYGTPIFLESNFGSSNFDYVYLSEGQITAYEFSPDHQKDVTLLQINNNGIIHDIEYYDLDDSNQIYSGNNQEAYPYVNINYAPNMKLVGQVRESVGGYERFQDFRYTGAVSNYEGLGFQGFKQIKRTNIYGTDVQRIWSITDYDIQKRGATTRSWTSLMESSTPNAIISRTDNTYTTQLLPNKVFVNVKASSSSQDGLTGVNTSQSFTYDTYYNPTNITSTYPGGSEVVIQQFVNNPTPFNSTYTIGRLNDVTTTKTLNGETFSSQTKYIFNNNLTIETHTKGNGTPWLIKKYFYDAFGNIIEKRTTGSGISDRLESYEYDSSGRFMEKSIDTENLETTYSYNYETGNPIRVTSAYGLTIDYTYDDWGRVIIETDYLGKDTVITYANDTSYGSGGSMKMINYDQGEDEKVYFNALGWTMEESILSLNNNWINKKYEYDSSGKTLRESEPYFSGSSPTQWNVFGYDEYGRTITQQLFTGKIISTTYNGLSATVNDGVKTVTTTKDALGNIVTLQDDGGTITYTYFANNEMKSANYDGNIVNVGIDGWGRKIALSDPSAGNYSYEYNLLGEITKERTPKGETTYTYSSIGKLISKSITGDNTDVVTDYEYDPSTKLLSEITATDNKNNIDYYYTYNYDSYGRLDKITENNGSAFFEKTNLYDTYGRVYREIYSSENSLTGVSNIVQIKNIYDNAGILTSIEDFTSGNRLWHILSENARGQALDISLGNNLNKTKQYDQYGFLTEIKDYKIGTSVTALRITYSFNAQRGILNSRQNFGFTNWSEVFTHDDQDRLTQINGAVNHQQDYDLKGRITDNSFVGEYNYSSSAAYQLEDIDLNNQGDLYYQQNKLQQITYNAFKKPVEIYQEDKERVSFYYGPFNNRTQAFYGDLNTDIADRHYHKQYSSIIPVEMIHDRKLGTNKIVTYIGGDAYSAPIAYIFEEKNNETLIDQYHYLHRDYLGSILAITDSSTTIVEQRQFGAWGITDKFIDKNGNTTFSYDSLIGRGFTGHEHFFDVSLIHMNGRMYDAQLGKFLSPDNFVQDPYNTQSFNRYSYVWNNPLSYNDISGEWFWAAALVGAVFGALAGASAYIGQAIQTGDWNIESFSLAVLGGAIVGGITGGFASYASCMSIGNIASALAGGIVGAFLPSFNIPIGDWNISVSATVAFGNSFGIGSSLSVGYSDGNWNFSAGIGHTSYGNFNGFGNGIELRKSILAAFDDGKTGFTYGTNFWTGKNGMKGFKQQTGIVGVRIGDFNIRYENDGSIGPAGDGGDSFRSASLQLSINDYSMGFQLFTGYRNLDEEKLTPEGYKGTPGTNLKDSFGRNLPNGAVLEEGEPYRLGALSFGYKGYRIGVNSEKVRHAIQNHAVHNFRLKVFGVTLIDKRQRGFENQSWDVKQYFEYKTNNNYTSW